MCSTGPLAHLFFVLVTSPFLQVCQVADFGLSRSAKISNDYEKKHEGDYYMSKAGCFAVRWTSPEGARTDCVYGGKGVPTTQHSNHTARHSNHTTQQPHSTAQQPHDTATTQHSTAQQPRSTAAVHDPPSDRIIAHCFRISLPPALIHLLRQTQLSNP